MNNFKYIMCTAILSMTFAAIGNASRSNEEEEEAPNGLTVYGSTMELTNDMERSLDEMFLEVLVYDLGDLIVEKNTD